MRKNLNLIQGTKMLYRYLGQSGLLVSRICLGTMTFGMKDWGCDQKTANAIVRHFIDQGGQFIDTADMYLSLIHISEPTRR